MGAQHDLANRLKRPHSFVSAYASGRRRIEVLMFLQTADAVNADPCEILRSIRNRGLGEERPGSTSAPAQWLDGRDLNAQRGNCRVNDLDALKSAKRVMGRHNVENSDWASRRLTEQGKKCH